MSAVRESITFAKTQASQTATFRVENLPITVEVLEITPKLAESWLAQHNTRNRAPAPARIRLYSEYIEAGHWAFTGDTIKFASNGVLLDGQNRLSAVVKADKPVKMMVIRGLDPDAFRWIDGNKVRSTKDTFDVEGRTNTALLSAACHVMFELFSVRTTTKRGMTQFDAEMVLQDHPALPDFCKDSCKAGALILPSVRMVMGYITSRANADYMTFWGGVDSGSGLEQSSPALVLRNRLSANSARRAGRTRYEQVALIAHAWNAFYEGRKIQKLVAVNNSGRIVIPRILGYDPRPTGVVE